VSCDRSSPQPPSVRERRRPDDLSLYVLEGCGYCERVRDAARDLGLELEERDIREEPAHRAALVEARGRKTVPVLRIAGTSGDAWMGESRDIVAYLYERFGEGRRPPVRLGPWAQALMWGLLLGGGVSGEPTRSALWSAACAVAAARSGWMGWRSRWWVHWAVFGAFAFGAVSIALSALEVAHLPWWYAAFAVAAVVLGHALVRRPARR